MITTTMTWAFDTAPSGTSPDVPGLWPISIDGRPYLADTSFEPYRRDAFRHRSIPSKRTASDFENIPGESSINTQGLWRREQIDWSKGAGQLFYDRKGSETERYYSSKGMDPFAQPWQLSLLRDTQAIYTSSNTNLKVVTVTSGLLYAISGQTLMYTSVLGIPSSWTIVANTPAATAKDITTDGYNVYVAYGSSGIYQTTAGSQTSVSYATGSVDVVEYALGHLIAAYQNNLYDVTGSGNLPTALYTHPNSGWSWVDICGGNSFLYFAGYAGDTSTIYRSTENSTGTALVVPIPAAPLLSGEQVYSIASYLNFVFIGSSLGARFCQTLSLYDPTGNAGDLRLGSVIPNQTQPVTLPVRCFMGHNRWVWFGWSDYDAQSSGLGRMDMSQFIDPLTPCYASDMMTPATSTINGDILSVAYFGGSPVFTVSGSGIYAATNSNLVPQGSVTTSKVTFGIPDKKIAIYLDMDLVEPLVGSYTASLSADAGPFTQLGPIVSASQPTNPLPIPQTRAEYFQTQVFLNSNGSTGGPTLERYTLKALPAIVSGTTISAVLRVNEKMIIDGQERFVDVDAELAFLENLRQTQKVVVYQEGRVTYNVTVDSLDYLPDMLRGDQEYGYNVAIVVYLTTLSG